jgi:chemotaxis protein CheX
MDQELETNIRSIVDLVWESTLGEPVCWHDVKRPTDSFDALITIQGGWNGCVHLACDEAAGRQAAAALFQIAPQDATPQDMRDALAEMVNIVGGNIKALLPDENTLSIPRVAQTPENLIDRVAGELLAELRFGGSVGACELRLYHTSAAPDASAS